MYTHSDARERALELALETDHVTDLKRKLDEEGYLGLLSQDELEAIVLESSIARKMIPKRSKMPLARVVGLIALLMGLGAIYMGKDDSRLMRRYHHSPTSYGAFAVVLGIVLIIKPSLGKENV